MRCAGLAVVLCLTIGLAAPARADDASKREKVHEMFALLHMERNVEQITSAMMKQVTAMTQQMTGTTKLPPETAAKLDQFQKQVFDLVSQQVSWDKMEPEYTELYAATYTEKELDGILAFYRSPEGAAMIAKTPELLSKSMALSQERMTKVMPQMMQMLQDFAKSAAPGGGSKSPPSAQ